jgi:hypothetical protein
MTNFCPKRGRPSRLENSNLRSKALCALFWSNTGFSNADIAVKLGLSVQDDGFSSGGRTMAVNKWRRDTLQASLPKHEARRRSRSVERYLNDAEKTLPDFLVEATIELASLKKDLTSAFALYGKSSQLGLPVDDLLRSMRPVFDRWERLGEFVLLAMGRPTVDMLPLDPLLDAVNVDELFEAMSSLATELGFPRSCAFR